MSFTRQAAERWHQEVPGARWFKADLHIHTIDDLPGGNARMPGQVSGAPENPTTLRAYARLLLREAAAKGVQVLGLTPHCPRLSAQASAVWEIVDTWNTDVDDDGIPFREKVFAVFPGFEPNLNDGREGIHLLFLFDPEIGRDRFLPLFDAIMDGRPPWSGRNLQMSPRAAKAAFDTIDRHRKDSNRSSPGWDYMVLAPHCTSEKGLFNELHSQPLATFCGERLVGYELQDDKLPEDYPPDMNPGRFLLPFMEKHRQSFLHGSDAKRVSQIGRRYTWLKLASPRIEAVRQAIVASDSRLRIAFRRGEDGNLVPIEHPPDVTVRGRPWLKAVTIRGGASFFGGQVKEGEGSVPRETTFEFSPDLTCVIGGSMTGKSTLLDGLRFHVRADLPRDASITKQVQDRAQQRFLPGTPEVSLECPGSDPTASLRDRWPAVFYAQNELQRLSQEASAVEEILARLVPAETPGIEDRQGRLTRLDTECSSLAEQLAELDDKRAEAAQACQRADQARQALAAFSEAGVEELSRTNRDYIAWREARGKSEALSTQISSLVQSVDLFELPQLSEGLTEKLGADAALANVTLQTRWGGVRRHLRAAADEMGEYTTEAAGTEALLAGHLRNLRAQVERILAARGFDASRLKEFQALNRQAALLPSYQANLSEVVTRLESAESTLVARLKERGHIVEQQREAFDRVAACIDRDFAGRILVSRADCGDSAPLDTFLRSFSQRGLTRWWNDLSPEARPTPESLRLKLKAGELQELGMSSAVQQTFQEVVTVAQRRRLAALRCPDRYELSLRMDDGSFRPLDELSGGQRVSVLLSLLLETADERPLVIDQPEDELDHRFLFETVLPTLKKLKGRRQVIVATHSPNIVVNGDADMVIQLEATANQGHVACAGAIEEPAVRDAIVRTVDGGDEAFRLRRLKYGF